MKSPVPIANTPQSKDDAEFKSEEIHDDFEAVGIDSFFTSFDEDWDEYSIDDFNEF